MLKKIIKKYGDSLVILFNKEDVKIYNLKEGDIINIESFNIERNK